MARSIATIQATMDAEQALQTDLTTLNSPSQTAIYRLWKFITSTIINYCEQLWDIYKSELETQISAAAVGSNAWLQSKVMKFQYSASTPQVLAVDSNFAINYPTIDTTLQIITRCSVTTTSQRVCLVKVAKSDPPVALSAPELSSLSGIAGWWPTVPSLGSGNLPLHRNEDSEVWMFLNARRWGPCTTANWQKKLPSSMDHSPTHPCPPQTVRNTGK